jgi:two-component system phosphate regulon response regulator OmpR
MAKKCAPILAVDDDPHIRRLIDRSLRAEGYETEVAVDSESAIEALRRGSYSLVLLDVMMPGETGFDLARRIRAGDAGEANRAVPILFVTAEDDGNSFEVSFEVGAIGYVTKPFEPDALVDQVGSMLHG